MTGRSLEKTQSALSEIEKAGIKGTLSAVQLDVTDEQSIFQAVKLVEESHGRLDALVNNAGVGGNREPDLKTRMQACMETNVVGATLVAAAFRPLLLKSPKPYSIFVSSGAGSLTRLPQRTAYRISNEEAYRASKAALNMIALLEWMDHGPNMKVFAISPGFVVSNLRGTDDDSRNGWGMGAGNPDVAGDFILNIINGERDADAGKLIHKDGVYPW